MKRPRSHVLEDESILALRNLLPSEWIVREKSHDYGIDIEIEIVEGKEVTNKVIWLQLKATESIQPSKKSISFPMKTKHLKYYEGCHLPVIILFWVKNEDTFYYVFSQKFIRDEFYTKNPGWRLQETVTIKLSSDSKLENIETLKPNFAT